MNTKDFIVLIWENLMRRKERVALTAIGVVVGTASILILVSLITALKNNAAQSLFGISEMKKIQVSPGYGENDNNEDEMFGGYAIDYGEGGNERKPTAPINRRALEYLNSIPGVVSVVPLDTLSGFGTLNYEKQESWSQIMGVETSNLSELGAEAAEGKLDLLSGTILIGASVSDDFSSSNTRPGEARASKPELLGETVSLVLIKSASDGQESRKVMRFRVIGILKKGGGENDWSAFISMRDMEALNQWATGKRVNRDRKGYQQAIVFVKDSKLTMGISKQIQEKGYKTYTAQSFLKGINSFFLILQLIFGGVGAISLFVAAIGISNTMAMAILERTREIGLMKAIGATNQDVLTIFLGEAGGIGFLGGVGGALLGGTVNLLIGFGVRMVLSKGDGIGGLAVTTSPGAVLFIILFSTFVGIVSGVYPSLRAATLVPVEALRTE